MTLKRTQWLRKPPDAARLTVTVTTLRSRKCRICFTRFTPDRKNVTWCGVECGALVAQEALAKKQRADEKARIAADRVETKARKQALKRRADYIKDAQTAFNAFVRARDAALPCICCGKVEVSHATKGWDAGHYLSRGSHPHLRFDERNVFRQRKGCNRPGGTTAASFRLGVIARIGLAAVEALEADQTPRKWTVEELQQIKVTYRAKLKALTKENI